MISLSVVNDAGYFTCRCFKKVNRCKWHWRCFVFWIGIKIVPLVTNRCLFLVFGGGCCVVLKFFSLSFLICLLSTAGEACQGRAKRVHRSDSGDP